MNTDKTNKAGKLKHALPMILRRLPRVWRRSWWRRISIWHLAPRLNFTVLASMGDGAVRHAWNACWGGECGGACVAARRTRGARGAAGGADGGERAGCGNWRFRRLSITGSLRPVDGAVPAVLLRASAPASAVRSVDDRDVAQGVAISGGTSTEPTDGRQPAGGSGDPADRPAPAGASRAHGGDCDDMSLEKALITNTDTSERLRKRLRSIRKSTRSTRTTTSRRWRCRDCDRRCCNSSMEILQTLEMESAGGFVRDAQSWAARFLR